MMRRILAAAVAAAAAAAAAAAVMKKLSDKKEEEKPEETPAEDEDEVNFIKIDDGEEEEKPAEEPAKEETPAGEPVKEEIPAEEPVKEEIPAEEPVKEEIPVEEPVKEEAEEEEFPAQVNEIAKLYPYLDRKFIAEQFGRNDAFTAQYPEDTLVTISHKAKFPDASSLEAFAKIAQDNGYASTKISDDEMLISRRFFTEDGAILSDIYNVANQTACLKGTYEGYSIEI